MARSSGPSRFRRLGTGTGRCSRGCALTASLLRVGVECTGTYGAGVSRCLAAAGVPVLEVTGPDPLARRAQGKDDALDAVAAAQATRTGYRAHVAKNRTGAVEALRTLYVARRSAVKGCRVAQQQLHGLIVSAPERLRDQLRDLPRMKRLRDAASGRVPEARARAAGTQGEKRDRAGAPRDPATGLSDPDERGRRSGRGRRRGSVQSCMSLSEESWSERDRGRAPP